MSAEQVSEWGLLLKARFVEGRMPERARLETVLAELPGPDRRLTVGTDDFTMSCWIRAADAAAATANGAAVLRAACQREGLPALTVIRSHAASVEGRSADGHRVEGHLDATNDWAIDIKAAAPGDHSAVDSELPDPIQDALGLPDASVTLRGDPEKFLLDDGSGFTIRFWMSGATPAQVYRSARESMVHALARAGLEGWKLVRFKARAPHHLHSDTFPGADVRSPRETEETR